MMDATAQCLALVLFLFFAVQWVLDRGSFLDSLGQTVSSGAGAPTWLLMQFNSVVTDI